jgi:hypothetical protein
VITCDKCNAPLTEIERTVPFFLFSTQGDGATWDGFNLTMQHEELNICERCLAAAALMLAKSWIQCLEEEDGEVSL